MKKQILFLLFGTVASTLLFSCRQGSAFQVLEQGPSELPFATIAQGTTVIEKEYTASIEGVANVEIRPQVSGYLTKIYVDEGDFVKAGQPLFKIDDRIYQEQIRSLQGALTSAEANLLTAKINLDRKQELVRSTVVTDIQVQEAQAAYNAAKGAVEQARSAIESARINLNFTTIKAPVSGYVGRFNSRIGTLLSPSDPNAITLLSDISQVNVYFSMSENDFALFQQEFSGNTIAEKLRNAPAISLITSDGNKYEIQGKVDAVDGQFNKNTGSITLRAKFDNPKTLLRSGNTGKVVMEQRNDNAVVFPIASTMSIQDKVFAFTVDKDNKAVQHLLTISGKSGQNFIVTDGIKPGDKYIVSGFERLQNGDTVVEQKATEGDQDSNW